MKVLFLLFVTCFTCSCFTSDLYQAVQWNREGKSAYQKKQFKKAAQLLEKAAKLRIREYIPAQNAALSYYKLGQLSRAHEILENIIMFRPDLPSAHFADGLVLFAMGQKENTKKKKSNAKECLNPKARQFFTAAKDRFEAAIHSPSWLSQVGDFLTQEMSLPFFKKKKPDPPLTEKARQNIRVVDAILQNKNCGGQSQSSPQTQNSEKHNRNKPKSRKDSSSSKPKPRPSLSKAEKKKMEKELQRIRANSRKSYFHQSKQQGFNSKSARLKKGKSDGIELIW